VKKSWLIVRIIFFLVLIASISYTLVSAYSWCQYPASFSGRTVQGCKDVFTDTVNNVKVWKGWAESKVINGAALSQVGEDIWTDTRYCNYVAVDNYSYGGKLQSNTTRWAASGVNHNSCPCAGSVNYGVVYVKHAYSDGSTWFRDDSRPTNQNIQSCP